MIILFLLLDASNVDIIDILTKVIVSACVGLVIWLIKTRHDDREETKKKINQSKLEYAILNTQIEEWRKYNDKKETEYSGILKDIKGSLKKLVEDVTELKVDFAKFKN
ncbi:hypothetical protein KAR91_70465 [Candidatus Pacearchaeota archaeon]|nr:hypothetical protein [Candidatus Pacearchaeota archaeon]